MKQKTGTRQKATNLTRDMAEEAMNNYDRTLRTGVKFQEEAMQWWMHLMNQAASTADWQKRITGFLTVTSNLMPAAQQRMQEMMALMNKNSRAGAELMNKAVEAAQSPTFAESQNKWMDFWTSSLGAIRTNVEAITEINNRAIDSWIDFARKNSEATEVRLPKMA